MRLENKQKPNQESEEFEHSHESRKSLKDYRKK